MGAVESTHHIPPSPSQLNGTNILQPGHALHAFLNVSKPLPTDPDHPFYTSLFHEYVQLYPLAPQSISQITTAALNLPSGPHAVALVAAVRAVVHRMRSDDPAPLFGALLLARTVISELRRAAPDDPVCLVLGAGDAERSLCPADRMDLGKSLIARLTDSVLNLILHENRSSSTRVTLAAIELLLIILGDQLYAGPMQSQSFSQLLDKYPHPEALIISLLDIVADASSSVDQAALLNIGTEHVPSVTENLRKPVNLNMSASASAMAFQMGFTDAISAISSRLPFSSSSADAKNPRPASRLSLAKLQQDASFEKVHVSDPQADVYAPFAHEALRYQVSPSEFDVDTQYIMADAAQDEALVVQTESARTSKGNGDGVAADKVDLSANANPSNTQIRTELAERALIFVCILCSPRSESPYARALCEIQNQSRTGEQARGYSFSKLYEMLGKWLLHPCMALLAYYFIIGNKRFRIFALARTDPDVLVVPLLASLKRRCYIGVVPADAYVPGVILLTLTSDKGFCEAIDAMRVSSGWLKLIEDQRRLGNEEISMSGLVVLVCSRVVQQSLIVRRREPDCFLANVCAGIMGNICGDVTNVHSLAAERLVSLLEFLGRRRRKAILYMKRGNDMPMAPPRVSESGLSGRHERAKGGKVEERSRKSGSFEKSSEFVERLTEYVGLCLEMIVRILQSRSNVSANRQLVYTLLHREAVLENEYVRQASEQTMALSHMIGRMVEFFGKLVDEWCAGMEGGRRSSQGISVERVYEVIDENARHIGGDMFDGVPDMRMSFEETPVGEEFLRAYSWSLATRRLKLFSNVDTSVMRITLSCFQPSE